MPYPFGFSGINFGQLLNNLRKHCRCRVSLLDEGGIPDTDESQSGTLYLVVRIDDPTKYAFVEVYHEGLPVFPAVIESLSDQLRIDRDRLIGGAPN